MLSIFWKRGSKKQSVLPDPVYDYTQISLLRVKRGIEAFCIGVGFLKPSLIRISDSY